VTRYFDHIQNQKLIRQAVENFAALQLVQFDLDNAPAVEKKAEPQKKKEKKAATGPASTPALVKDAATVVPPTQESVQKEKPQKEKKEKKKDAVAAQEGGKTNKGAKVAPAAAEDAGVPVPSMIDLRVGHIVDGKTCSLPTEPCWNPAYSHEASRC
jgi:aminoacyl tRNA synthase complex-interacting multifunctional protein 1